MGDFAAGKLIDQVEIAPVTVEDFDQFVTDFMGYVDSHADDPPPVNGPANGADIDQLVGCITSGTPAELLVCLMQWSDGGFSIKDYEIHSCQQLLADFGAGNPVIGHDLDGDALTMDPATGFMEQVSEDLGQYLGRFRFELCGGRIEWCDGWVEKA